MQQKSKLVKRHGKLHLELITDKLNLLISKQRNKVTYISTTFSHIGLVWIECAVFLIELTGCFYINSFLGRFY